MKNLNWKNIPQPKRSELQKLAQKMRRKGFAKIQINAHGSGKFSVDGFDSVGGVWCA